MISGHIVDVYSRRLILGITQSGFALMALALLYLPLRLWLQGKRAEAIALTTLPL